ncbi:sugar phosphate isomerase/epimerase [Ferruginibacter sp.]|uniref:sugar phosphate isomerase/epimerase family protein n=1 Tax=Ferruginibacter sp. TaxID=1940288 RepID=UPI00198B67AF|nr:sugar phosphate isomerase/epimerase [Ferruginibacter sp.]MBC7625948.1 sugar phosphate isomerase/epimerase [Ferruginibacter sp.]
MTTRRSFIKSTSIISAGLLLTPPEFNRRQTLIGVQLYTVRELMQQNPADTLAKVAKVGFNSVEGATYTGSQKFYGMDPATFSKLLKDNGLIMPSAHYRLGEEKTNGENVKGTMLHEWDKAVDDAAAVGLKYMVCAYLSSAERGGLDHYKYVADQLNIAGEKCKKAGIQLCYHNHDFEFVKQDNTYPMDILFGADKDLVKFEMDLYWVTKAGMDPIVLFSQHPGRFPLMHLKDMDKTEEKAFTEVGNGVIDFKTILKHQKTAGLKYFFVEQDKCPGSPIDSITQSYNYIKKNLI